MPVEIRFFYNNSNPNLKQRNRLKTFISSIFKQEGKMPGKINFIFCKDETLLEINRTYLNHNYYTDVITFNLSQSDQIDADIFISLDRVRENAEVQKTTLKTELLRVMFHGVLHLCGYDDKSIKEKKQIREKEDFYLSLYNRFT
ncbi:MAG: rRNA maturation RNase YbeY [Chitinophagaceae bacterium]